MLALLLALRKYWQLALFAGLILSNMTAFNGWHSSHVNLVKEQAAHKLDIANFKQAQTDANKQAQATRDSLIKESKTNADQADAKYGTLLSSYRANLLRYQANQSGGSQADHSQLSTPQGGNGPSPNPVLPSTSITISTEDANVCAVDIARLVAVHDWAVSLPKEPK